MERCKNNGKSSNSERSHFDMYFKPLKEGSLTHHIACIILNYRMSKAYPGRNTGDDYHFYNNTNCGMWVKSCAYLVHTSALSHLLH